MPKMVRKYPRFIREGDYLVSAKLTVESIDKWPEGYMFFGPGRVEGNGYYIPNHVQMKVIPNAR